MAANDPWSKTDQLEETLLDGMVTRLETRAKHGAFKGMLEEYLDAMDIDGKKAVLDLGCGTGVAARAIAKRRGFSGAVLGIDLSPYLVQAAERLAAEEGLAGSATFKPGDTRSLGLEDGQFDAVVLHTLVSHVSDPLSVVKEAARVVRPGGMVGIFDGDFASRTFAQEDPAKTKQDDDIINHSVATSPYAMRQMPRYLKQAGLELAAFFGHVLAEAGQADFWKSSIESNRKLMPQTGAMSEGQANGWANALVKASEEGVFFGANNFYSYVARKP
jgi:ubiquinone/menaquinone biosynthesis C-methylase UbiE